MGALTPSVETSSILTPKQNDVGKAQAQVRYPRPTEVSRQMDEPVHCTERQTIEIVQPAISLQNAQRCRAYLPGGHAELIMDVSPFGYLWLEDTLEVNPPSGIASTDRS
jgi:hypothetical protein